MIYSLMAVKELWRCVLRIQRANLDRPSFGKWASIRARTWYVSPVMCRLSLRRASSTVNPPSPPSLSTTFRTSSEKVVNTSSLIGIIAKAGRRIEGGRFEEGLGGWRHAWTM